MQKYYPGAHFFAAHLSPDLDTTVASFIGWLDAFSAKVGEGVHIWSLPGGINDSSIVGLFESLFGIYSIKYLARTSLSLTLTAMDLVERDHVKIVNGSASILDIDQGLHTHAVLLVDDTCRYLGDWHSVDAENVRPLLILLDALLRQFESQFYIRLIRFFAQPEAHRDGLYQLENDTFHARLESSMALREAGKDNRAKLHTFLQEVLFLQAGLQGTFSHWKSLLRLKLIRFQQFHQQIQQLFSLLQFDSAGILQESRTHLFQVLEELLALLNHALQEIRLFTEQLSTAVHIKERVFHTNSFPLTTKSEVEEIRAKMQTADYLPVVMTDKTTAYPIGIVRAQTLQRFPLGTVSTRDFSNPDEMRMAPYLTIISVIDHHKSSLQTITPPPHPNWRCTVV